MGAIVLRSVVKTLKSFIILLESAVLYVGLGSIVLWLDVPCRCVCMVNHIFPKVVVVLSVRKGIVHL